jgi:hypothetical protein
MIFLDGILCLAPPAGCGASQAADRCERGAGSNRHTGGPAFS